MTQTKTRGPRFTPVQLLLIAVVVVGSACSVDVPPTLKNDGNALSADVLPGHRHARVCGKAPHGHSRCHAWVRVNEMTGAIQPFATPSGFGPADLASAYDLPATGGSGLTIAIVDAQDAVNAEADLGVYRAQFGLPPCTTENGCFLKVNQSGATSPLPIADSSWAEEISLDVQMASAICPSCNILLVEADSASNANLGAAVNAAVSLGANVVSNSYGGGESTADPATTESFYNHPGVLITASSGDEGFGVEYPAAATTVLAVGGTSLVRDASSRGWSETVWGSANNTNGGTGSGCSSVEAKPSWQQDTGCPRRTVADVSAIADPQTGVSVYDSAEGGWLVFGGTSVASPVVAAIFALTGNASATPQYPYANTLQFFDVTSGVNGSCGSYLCTAVDGYDGPTGIGTPNGNAMAGLITPPPNDFSIAASPATLTLVAGTSADVTLTTATTSGVAQTITFSASGAPGGVTTSFSPASVVSGGTATLTLSTTGVAPAGTFTLTVTGTTVSGTQSIPVTVTITNSRGNCIALTQLLANPGFESGDTDWTASSGVIDASTGGSAPHTGSVKAWLDGYGQSHTDDLYQTVTLPSNACTAVFSFWLKITTAENTTLVPYDKLSVTVRNSFGTALATLASYSNLNKSSSYIQQTFDLSAFIGQSVRLEFVGTEDNSLQTSFFIDDTEVNIAQ